MSWCARPIPNAPSPSTPGGWGSTSGSTAASREWGSRLLFFRCGDLVVEIAHDLKKGVSDGPDQLWGLSWRMPDVAQGQRRLKQAGVEVSAPRDGRRPGSQVFTVKNQTEGVPTMVIGGSGAGEDSGKPRRRRAMLSQNRHKREELMRLADRSRRRVLALPLAPPLASPASAQGVLNVYCSVQVEWCTLLANEFQKASGIKVSMTQKGSGETIAQLKAEAQNPKGDVWFGGTGDPHLQAAEEGLTEVYKSPKMAELHPWAVKQNTDSGGKTVGIYAGALGFGFNTELLAKKNVKAPACWADLLKPEFKGEIQMANPNSSGTAYVAIATLVQLMGEEKAFDYLKKMHANINAYTRSGTAPMKAVARGETMVSISFVHDGVTEALAGFPVKTATPCEGTGYEIGSMSIVKGARNMANAKKFYDWALTPEAQKLEAQAKQFQVPSNKATPLPPEAPKFADMKLIDYDQAKYGKSAERKRLIARWDSEVGALPKP